MAVQTIEETQEITDVERQTPERLIKKTTKVVPEVTENNPQKEYKTKKAIFRTYQIVWYILGVIEILLAFRIILKLIGANPFNGFTSFIYALSGPFAIPFLGVISPSLSGQSVMEWSSFVAMAVYAVIAWGIIELFQIIRPTNRQEVDQAVNSL